MANSATRLRDCLESVRNVYDNAKRFYWTSRFINEAIIGLKEKDCYGKLTIRDKCYVDGFIEAHRKQVDRLISHAYLCNDGKFRPDPKVSGYERYDYPSSKSPRTLIDTTCVLVWANRPSNVYFCDDATLAIIREHRVTVEQDEKRSVMVLPSMVERYDGDTLTIETELRRRQSLYRDGATANSDWTASVSADGETVRYYYRHIQIDKLGQSMR